jgi:hypothetical protein
LGRGPRGLFDDVLFLYSYLRSPFQPDFFCHADVEKGGFRMDPRHYCTLRSSAYPCAIHRYYRSPVLCRPYLVALRDHFFRSNCPRKRSSVLCGATEVEICRGCASSPCSSSANRRTAPQPAGHGFPLVICKSCSKRDSKLYRSTECLIYSKLFLMLPNQGFQSDYDK